MNNGSNGSQYQFQNGPSWGRTISDRFRLPAAISTPTRVKPNAISYDTTCAAVRIAPSREYLELGDQPAIRIPYTPREVMASTYSKPTFMSASTQPSLNGMTAQTAKAGTSASNGARMNKVLLAAQGIVIPSLTSLPASARGCSNPQMPTLLGPLRTCIQPSTLRSA